MKNNLDFYRHDVNSHSHWKFKTLRRKYSWAGEGKFWALNNMIAESDGCTIDLNDPERKASIAVDLDFDIPELDEYISFLISSCKLLFFEGDGKIGTEKVMERYEAVNGKRERQRNWKKEKSTEKNQKSTSTLDDSLSTEPVVDDENQQSKVKKSKLKQSKDNTGAAAPPPSHENLGKKKNKKFTEPTLEELTDYFFHLMGSPKKAVPWPHNKCHNEAFKMFNHYGANGWVQAKGKPIIDWKKAAVNWVTKKIEGVFEKPSYQPQPAAAKKESPGPAPLTKTQQEMNYFYGLFLENKLTIISLGVQHYNFLKSAGMISFTEKQSQGIKVLAVEEIRAKKLSEDEATVMKFMKLFGTLEFFGQQKSLGKKIIFDEKEARATS